MKTEDKEKLEAVGGRWQVAMGRHMFRNHGNDGNIETWLVGGLVAIFYFPIYLEQSSQLTFIFFRGIQTTNQKHEEAMVYKVFEQKKHIKRLL